MNARRLRLILSIVLVLLSLAFLAILVTGLSLLGSKSQKMTELKLQSRTADEQLSSLERSKKEIDQYSYFKEVAKTVIPDDKDQAQALLEISQIANESGISLQSVSFPASSLGSRATVGSSTGGTSGTNAAPSLISQAKPVTGINGLYSIELTVTPETGTQVSPDKLVTYPKMLDFLDRIERNRRTAQITQVNIQPVGGAGPNQLISFNLTLNIFIKP